MRVPTALPYVFTALKVASVLAMIGAIVGEYFGGSFNALGVLINSDAQIFHFETAWAGILVASLLGLALYVAVAIAERLVVRWAPESATRKRIADPSRAVRIPRNGHRGGGDTMKKRCSCGSRQPWRRCRSRRSSGAATAAPRQAQADERHAAAQVGAAGAVRRLLRGVKQGLLQGAGLNVTLKNGGPNIIPEQVVASGQAQFGVDWLPSLLAARDKGTDLVNVAQVFARSGMTQLTWKDSRDQRRSRR